VKVGLTYPHVNLTGGMERVIVESANELAGLGHEVHVFASSYAPGVLDDAVVRHHVAVRPRPDAAFALGFRRRCAAALQRLGPDVHGAFTALSPLGGVYWTPSVHRTAYIGTLSRRGGAARVVQQLNPYHRFRLRLERQMLSAGGYARVIALTDRIREEVLEHYGLPAGDVTVLPFGFEPGRFNAGRRAALRDRMREELGYGDDDRVVLFVANELERKGFDTLLEAVALMGDESVRVHVVGRVDENEEAARITRLGLADRVLFAGSTDDVGAHHAAADAFALPTRYEPWGLVIVEALASGLPVVTTRLAGASRAVGERTGRLLDSPDDPSEAADALAWALGPGPAPAEEISDSVHWLTWGEIGRSYADLLGEAA
jgi:UDP-glucose:(heptosyl)LPS alpha-1,3-glucosyltransferase